MPLRGCYVTPLVGDPTLPYSPTFGERLYEKASSASQSPQHEATHGSVHERLAGCTQLLVVLAHPSIVANPGKGAFHHPAAWEELKGSRWQKLLPIDHLAFLGQFLRPTHQHFFGGGFVRTFDQFHTPSQNLLHPTSAFLLAPVTSVQPQV